MIEPIPIEPSETMKAYMELIGYAQKEVGKVI